VLGVWQEHLSKWASELSFTVVRGSREARRLDWKYPAHVYVTTYDTVASDFLVAVEKGARLTCAKCKRSSTAQKSLRSNPADLQSLLKCKLCGGRLQTDSANDTIVDSEAYKEFDAIVADEAQYIKNPDTDRSKSVKNFRAKYRWALTGTPLETKVDDVVSIFDFLMPGYIDRSWLAPHRLQELIRPFVLRRLKKEVLSELPPKIREETWLELDGDQRREYEAALQHGRAELELLGGKATKIHIFALLTKLKQICNFASAKNSSPKTEALCDLLNQIKESGQKALVFTQYSGPFGVERLSQTLTPFGVAVMTGELSDKAKQEAKHRFKHDSSVSTFLMTVKTGGLGLTLTEANYVIHFDHWWNPATMWQAEDRVHRIGQLRGVNIYSFWVQNTIEEKIYQKLKDRGLLFEQVINGLSEEAVTELISTEDWLEMLGVPTAKTKRAEAAPTQRETQDPISAILTKISAIDPLRFEQLVTTVMSRIGFADVRTTKRSRDGGIDINATRQTLGGTERIVAQCKRMERIGVEFARELLGVIAADQSISKGFLITSGLASPECRAFCERDGRLSVVEGPLLAKYLIQFDIDVTMA